MVKKNKMTKEYDDEYEEEDQGEDNPELEADPSAGGSVKQIHEQITMCVKECESGTSRNPTQQRLARVRLLLHLLICVNLS